MKAYRVWFKNDSMRLVYAESPEAAKQLATELAKLNAADINIAWATAKQNGQDDRAKELTKEYLGYTVVKRVEELK